MESLQLIPEGGFNSVNEVTASEKLSSQELTILENMRLDEKMGLPTIRKGFSRYSSEVDSSGVINAIYDLVDKDGDNYLYVSTPTKIRKSLNGTEAFSDVKTGLTNTNRPRLAKYGGKFFITNGIDDPFYTDNTDVADMSIPRFDASAITITLGGTADPKLSEGTYRYVIINLTTDGQRSNPSGTIQPFYQTSGYDSVTLNDILFSSDERISSRLIFRTKVNLLNRFYLLATIDNGVTVYVDTTPDDSLDTTETIEYMNTPNTAKYIMANTDRLFFANINKTYTNRIIPPPNFDDDSSVIISGTSAGVLLTGIYKYAFSLIDQRGNESDLVPYVTYALLSDNKSINIVLFPVTLLTIISGDSVYNTNIKTVRYYRTKKNGSDYYFIRDIISFVALPTTPTINDDAADSTLTIIYPKAATDPYPIYPTAPTFESGVSKISSGTVDLTSSIVFSNLFKPLEIPELNIWQIYPDDEDPITGVFDDDNGIMIFKKKSICKLYTNSSPENWYRVKIIHNIGCDEPDTIFKYQSSYFFVFKNKSYIFNGTQVKEISYKRKPTFDSVTSFIGSTFWDSAQWYILSVKIGSGYFLLCYDLKLKTWYKFSISQADAISRKEFGSDTDKILFGGNLYITSYDESQTYDSDTGADANITIQLQTGDISFPDNFVRARLMFFFNNYQRLKDTSTKEVLFKLNDPASLESRSLFDDDETYNQNIYRISTDGMLGNLKRCNKLNLNISGQALSIFYNARIDYLPETWGVRKKQKTSVEGLGMKTGTKAGVNL